MATGICTDCVLKGTNDCPMVQSGEEMDVVFACAEYVGAPPPPHWRKEEEE